MFIRWEASFWWSIQKSSWRCVSSMNDSSLRILAISLKISIRFSEKKSLWESDFETRYLKFCVVKFRRVQSLDERSKISLSTIKSILRFTKFDLNFKIQFFENLGCWTKESGLLTKVHQSLVARLGSLIKIYRVEMNKRESEIGNTDSKKERKKSFSLLISL